METSAPTKKARIDYYKRRNPYGVSQDHGTRKTNRWHETHRKAVVRGAAKVAVRGASQTEPAADRDAALSDEWELNAAANAFLMAHGLDHDGKPTGPPDKDTQDEDETDPLDYASPLTDEGAEAWAKEFRGARNLSRRLDELNGVLPDGDDYNRDNDGDLPSGYHIIILR